MKKIACLRSRKKAFTLLELLISMAVLSLLMALLFQIFELSMRTWQNAEQRTDAFREARAALHIISRDLRNTLRGNSQVATLILGERSPSPTPPNQEIYALTTVKNNGGKSDVCAVGFYCYWDDSRGAFMLKRYFRNSDDTFPLLGNPSQLFQPAPANRDNATDSTLAAYVWDFQVTALDTNGAVMNYPLTVKTNLPASVQVEFKALNAQATRKIKAQGIDPNGWFEKGSEMYRNSIQPYVQQFTTRIPLIGPE
ncbi:MAG: prepilin-type N-terminal cleavage/methylation domain-containing protein [Verrucomicrobiae bacterium]|nr:prepilin-type N-terminal cleavage/methylation domain-containing protein [Verrucomicrobiae bacterium]